MNSSIQDNAIDRFREQLRKRPRSFLLVILIVVILNIWFDYYRPLGVLFDVILLSALFRSYLRSRYRAGQRAKS
jgi:accessory gene regulator protein AgrB